MNGLLHLCEHFVRFFRSFRANVWHHTPTTAPTAQTTPVPTSVPTSIPTLAPLDDYAGERYSFPSSASANTNEEADTGVGGRDQLMHQWQDAYIQSSEGLIKTVFRCLTLVSVIGCLALEADQCRRCAANIQGLGAVCERFVAGVCDVVTSHCQDDRPSRVQNACAEKSECCVRFSGGKVASTVEVFQRRTAAVALASGKSLAKLLQNLRQVGSLACTDCFDA